jgi:deoxycytidine triphosphate deaminase
MEKRQEYLWQDPFHRDASSGAVLLSDQIDFLASKVGLVHPFSAKLLRPAAYDIRVGSAYYVDDKRKELDEHEGFAIPANGLVYVRTLEEFRIPYYLVARYSLRVQQVYRGLLIDNGLHIDPGYSGFIWIPVHNFTNEPRTLVRGQEFISVEFNRTTPLPKSVQAITSEDELVSLALSGKLVGSNERPIHIFYKDLASYQNRHKEFVPPVFWNKFPGEKHQSGILGIERRAREVQQRTDRRLNRFRTFGILAVAGVIVGLLAIVLPILYEKLGNIADSTATEVKTEIRSLRDQVQQQRVQIEALSARSAQANPPSPAPVNTKKGR